MSQFVTIETEINDPEILARCLKKLYPHVEQGRDIKLYNFVDRFLGQTADIVIRKKYIGDGRISNDVGFKYDNTSGTYKLVIGDFDNNTNRFDLRKLEHLYTEEKTIKELQKKGYNIIKHQRVNSKTITLLVERWK